MLFCKQAGEFLQAGLRESQVREEMETWNKQHNNALSKPTFEEKIGECIDQFNKNTMAMKSTTDESEMTNDMYATAIMDKYVFKCMFDNKDLLVYKDGVYLYNNKMAENTIEFECEKVMPEASIKRITEIVAMIKRRTFVRREDFDRDLELINCDNGIINIKTGKVIPHDPEFLFRNKCPVKYDPNYTTPEKFFEFLRVSVGDSKQIIQIIESMACCLLRTSRFEKAFMHIGSGSNGKSTFLSVLEKIIGRTNIAHVSPHALERERFASADLENKMLNVYADIVSETLTTTGKLKMVISGDEIFGERKHRDPFAFKPYAKLMFSANQLPDVEDQTNAMYRRWVIFKWDQKFEGKNQDRHLLSKLTEKEELNKIFSMLVQVAKTLINNDYKFRYEPTADDVRKIWQDHADPVESFIHDKCTKVSTTYITAVRLYQAYSAYCRDRQIDPKDRKYFYKKFSVVSDIPKTQKRVGSVMERVFEGITLSADIIEENKTQGQGSLFEGDDD